MVSAVTAATAAAATLKKSVAEDDFESQQKRHVRQPEMCVDYLSYTFDEMDLAASWRVMTKQKKDVVDGIRLENASWRTWAKQRNNLKTISPQTLNWLKDSDVTWLYGPLHTVIRTEEDPFLTPRQATTEETLGLMITTTKKQSQKEEKPMLKSALKKITTADLLKRSASELAQQQPAIATIQNRKQQRKISISDVNNELLAVSPVVLANHRQPRLRFNHQVEQCIALTDEEEREHEDIIEEEEEEEEEEELDDLESEGDEDTDQIITSHITYESKPVPVPPQRKSIKKIAPARLKKSQSDADTDDVSSISSTSTASSIGFTRSPVVSIVSSPVTRHLEISDDDDEESEAEEEDVLSSADDEQEKEEEEHEEIIVPTANHSYYTRPAPTAVDYSHQQTRPVPIRSNTSSSNSIITQTKIAEPALVTTHSTATDIQSSNSSKRDSNLLNHIATWAASYLWRPNGSAAATRVEVPSPHPSVSTSAISSAAAIPIERSFAPPPTSSNHSSL